MSLFVEPFVYRASKGSCQSRSWSAPTASCNVRALKNGVHQTHTSHLFYFQQMPIGLWKVGSYFGELSRHLTPLNSELWVTSKVKCRGENSHRALLVISSAWSVSGGPMAWHLRQILNADTQGSSLVFTVGNSLLLRGSCFRASPHPGGTTSSQQKPRATPEVLCTSCHLLQTLFHF